MGYEDAVRLLKENLPAAIVSTVLLLLAIGVAAKGLMWVKDLVTWFADGVARLKLGERRQAVLRRRHFVDSLLDRLKQINKDERWSDRRYSELEAEVEAEGSRSGIGPLVRLLFRSEGRRRERSLSRALRRSSDRLILLQGDPGSGKSVALRHVAAKLNERAKRSRRKHVQIALYVSLKEFRPRGPEVTAADVREYVLSTYSGLDEHRQVRYLRDNFDYGLEHGTWFFLFDSFDEIPEVMAAVEVDETIKRYENALSSFLSDSAPSRAVVASREYRGPRRLPWARFNIVALSERRRKRLIELSQMDIPPADWYRPNCPLRIAASAHWRTTRCSSVCSATTPNCIAAFRLRRTPYSSPTSPSAWAMRTLNSCSASGPVKSGLSPRR